MKTPENEEAICPRPEQSVQEQKIEESYRDLCTPNILIIFSSVKHCLIGTEKIILFWQDDISVSGATFVGFVHWYSDKAPMTLKAKSLIAFPAKEVLLNFSRSWNC